jgi:FtsH-binding integral membrane protein
MNDASRSRLLRIVLLFCGAAWGVSVVGVFLTWESAERALQGLGARPIEYDPMLDYWLRMAAGAFALVGAGFLLAAIYPRKYAVILPWLGWLMLVEGIVLLVHGLRLGLKPFPFYGDVAACFTGGVGILLLRSRARSD